MVLKTVARFRDVPAADLACTRLEADGVSAVVVHANHVRVDWLISQAIGGVRVQVAESDLERAREALARERSDDLAVVSEAALPPADGDVCPECGAESVTGSTLARRTKAASMFLGIPFVVWRRRWHCRACGHSWRPHRATSS